MNHDYVAKPKPNKFNLNSLVGHAEYYIFQRHLILVGPSSNGKRKSENQDDIMK